MMKRVVITGTTSMIGIALIEECIKNGVQVLALVRSNSKNYMRIPHSPLVQITECDLSELLEFVPGNDKSYDFFYHLGWAYTDKTNRYDAKKQLDNIRFALDAVELAARLGCHKFIGAGSQAEYGIYREMINEETRVSPQIAYGVAKYAAVKLCAIMCQGMELDCTWGRVFSVYGPYDNEGTMVNYAIDCLSQGKSPSFTQGTQMWDYLYSEDAGKAFYLLGNVKGRGNKVYCIAGGESMQLKEYIEILHMLVAPQIPIVYETGSNTEKTVSLMADISELKADMGFAPGINFEEGIKRLMRFKGINGMGRGKTFYVKWSENCQEVA